MRWAAFWLAYAAILQWVVPEVQYAGEVADMSPVLGVLVGAVLMNGSIWLLWVLIPKDDPAPNDRNPNTPPRLNRSGAALPACPNALHRSDKRKHGRSEPLTRHGKETASAREYGAALPPHAPDASRARVG